MKLHWVSKTLVLKTRSAQALELLNIKRLKRSLNDIYYYWQGSFISGKPRNITWVAAHLQEHWFWRQSRKKKKIVISIYTRLCVRENKSINKHVTQTIHLSLLFCAEENRRKNKQKTYRHWARTHCHTACNLLPGSGPVREALSSAAPHLLGRFQPLHRAVCLLFAAQPHALSGSARFWFGARREHCHGCRRQQELSALHNPASCGLPALGWHIFS